MASIDLQHVELPEYSPQALRLYDILNECLQPDSRTSVNDVSEGLLDVLPQNDAYSEIVTDFFMMIREVILDVPYSHPSSLKLAKIIHHVLRSPRFVDPSFCKDAEIYRYQNFHERVYLIFENVCDDDHTLNAHAFLAHFYIEAFPDDPFFSVALLTQAFEEERQFFLENREILAKSAAIWIWIYGGTLFRIVCDPSRDDDRWSPRGRYKARLQRASERRLTLDRWRFWTESFDEIASGTLTVGYGAQAGGKCKDLCRKAADMMRELSISRETSTQATELEK